MRSIGFSRHHAGFSFIEVLFAVMILGIGFVMLAGIFPVALSQTQSAADDSAGAGIGRSAMAQLAGLMTTTTAPPTDGAVVALSTSGVLGGPVDGRICDADNRYAWVAAYRRDSGSNVAQVFVIVTRARNRSAYEPSDFSPSGAADYPATLAWRSVKARLEYAGGSGLLHLTQGSTGTESLAPGGFLITASPGTLGENAGRVMRLGSQIGTGGDWELLPGNGPNSAAEEPDGAVNLLVVGRGYADPTRPEAGYSGVSQDVALYTTFVLLK